MRFLRKTKIEKTVLVLSDIHLGAGTIVKGRHNVLEDFHYDKELVDFLEYYSSGDYASRDVELIINGDLFDLLAVPYVEYFDDEYWSEEAALEKLKIIMEAHSEVMEGMQKFIQIKKKKIVFIIGNHDAEFALPELQNYLTNYFSKETQDSFEIKADPSGEYIPVRGVLLKHGHEYEIAHNFDVHENVKTDEEGKRYFIPPWGSYYVTRVVNKFKEERDHANAVRPVRKALINGLIYDTLYTIRFALATCYYFILVRGIDFFKRGKGLQYAIARFMKELELFHNLEDLCHSLFEARPEVKCLIVGHTHEPAFKSFASGNIYINTGTWTDMYHLDWGKRSLGRALTYAQVDVEDSDDKKKGLDGLAISLNKWKGVNHLPFQEF